MPVVPRQVGSDGDMPNHRSGAVPQDHDWIVAAEVHVDTKVAKHANLRGSFRTKEQQRIDALEVYCKACRRPYDDVVGEPCSALVNNEHLRGGPIGERAKRKVFEPIGKIVQGEAINRYGVDAYVNGDH